MRLFLDSNVVLAACGRPTGASRYVFHLAPQMGWSLLTSAYVVKEVEKNLSLRLPASALSEWRQLDPMLGRVADAPRKIARCGRLWEPTSSSAGTSCRRFTTSCNHTPHDGALRAMALPIVARESQPDNVSGR